MWEYKVTIDAMLSEETLNAKGAEQWEHYFSIGNKHYFKRYVEVAKPKKGGSKDRE
jgi:hypothetical protein